MNRVFPFERTPSYVPRWIKKLNFSYNFVLSNRITNVPSDVPYSSITPEHPPPVFTLDNLPAFIREGKNGARHNIPIATNYTLFKYFTSSINFNYTDLWYTKRLHHSYDARQNALQTETIDGFSRAGYYSLSHSTQTRFYGIFYWKKGYVKALRHTLNPSVSFSYRPDFSLERYGVYQHVRVPSSPEPVLRSQFDGFVYGTVPRGKAGSMAVSISNSIEAKVSNKQSSPDQEPKPFRNVTLIDNLSANATYNFLAEDFKLSNINLSTRFSVWGNKLGVNLVGTVDPYLWEPISTPTHTDQKGAYRRVNILAWQAEQSIGRLTDATVSVNFNLDNQKSNQEKKPARAQTTEEETTSETSQEEPAYLLPWSLSVGYTVNYRKKNLVESDVVPNAYLTGRINLTELTYLGFSFGYNFEQNELTQMNMNFSRDLHCWEFVGSWIPFGTFTSYEVTIRAKGTLLSSLQVNRRRSFFDPL